MEETTRPGPRLALMTLMLSPEIQGDQVDWIVFVIHNRDSSDTRFVISIFGLRPVRLFEF